MFERLASPKEFLTRTSTDCPRILFSAKFYTILVLVVSQFSLFVATASANTTVNSTRIWPASEYTRLTLESDAPINYSLILLKNPDRVVLDLIDVTLTSEIKKLPGKISADNLYIRALRIGQFKLGVLRLVLDLKSEVKPQAFVLKPVGDYGHRLVLDIYPISPPDPLMALSNEGAVKSAQANASEHIQSDRKSRTTITGNKEPSSTIRVITIGLKLVI